ncbi:hypothetical protein C6496_15580 [Candidatus Poribacteria bacterium]|nr:MAG: hypothetical protein C6496_15580 [Candidatus Poribacteria bacterium]
MLYFILKQTHFQVKYEENNTRLSSDGYFSRSRRPSQAKRQTPSAADLLAYKRGHWTIENQSHWIRDVVFGEDASEVRCADILVIMAALRNTAITILRFTGYTHISKTTRYREAKPKQALKLLTDTLLKLNGPGYEETEC